MITKKKNSKSTSEGKEKGYLCCIKQLVYINITFSVLLLHAKILEYLFFDAE